MVFRGEENRKKKKWGVGRASKVIGTFQTFGMRLRETTTIAVCWKQRQLSN